MEQNISQSHNIFTFIYAGSKMLERMAYYGMRALLVLYMVGETLNFSNEEALKVYGFFTMCVAFSPVVGAVFGDLVFGNIKALIIGGIVQALGCFAFCIPSEMGLYLAIGLIILGGGFFTPNLFSHFGKLYLGKEKLLDSAFTLLYFVINVGALFGTLLIGYFGELDFTYGFALAGLLMLLSVLLPIILKEQKFSYPSLKGKNWGESVLIIAVMLISMNLFWLVYDLTASSSFHFVQELSNSLQFEPRTISASTLNPLMIMFLAIVLTVLWMFFYPNRFLKLTVGFLLCAIGYGLFFLASEIFSATGSVFLFYLAYLFFLSLTEILIAPTVNSILVKYTNPKYLALVFSGYLLFVQLAILLFSGSFLLENYPDLIFIAGIVLMFGISVIMGILFFVFRKETRVVGQ